ncbi:MAG: hypothetical protein NTX38_05500 [Methylobacter sp.]|nr:hypothetical protein [Methylobacter sp.]
MLFNSPEFIYFFMPFSIAAWWVLQRMNREQDAQWLVVICSIYFYGWWDMRYVPLLIGNALGNFYLGQKISETKSKALLIAGLLYNICMLGYFKYANFFIENWIAVAGSQHSLLQLVLPLGISFFTFQVIAYLVDCHKGYVSDFNLGRFAFSISFYPHLIAGPILHYSDVMPQLRGRIDFDARQFSQGLFLFAAGLFKKSVIADRIAEHVDPLYAADTVLQFFESWVAAVGYGLQIYFDFSGYSDMAIGIGLMFGIILPQNFNSPYQAVNIADFWKRWHMTLSRFLRDYVYIPLGGSRNGFAKGLLAAAVTMIVGGRFAWDIYRYSPALDESRHSNASASSRHNYISIRDCCMGRIPRRICRSSTFYLERDDWSKWICGTQRCHRNLSVLHPSDLNHRHGIRAGRHFAIDLHDIRQCSETSATA